MPIAINNTVNVSLHFADKKKVLAEGMFRIALELGIATSRN